MSFDSNLELQQKADFNWYPGHMAKSKRKLIEQLRLIDVVLEVVDARAPEATQNADFHKILSSKPRILLLNKCDLADEFFTEGWINHYNSLHISNFFAMKISCSRPFNFSGIKKFIGILKKFCGSKKPTRVMVVGIPNVGKSTVINRLIGKNVAKVQDKAGVTRANQWFSGQFDIEVMDTPGIFPVKFSSATNAEILALLGTIKENILDVESLVFKLIDKLKIDFFKNILSRYKINFGENELKNIETEKIISEIARKRGMLISGGNTDFSRVSIMLLNEFRSGKLGKISLEKFESCL